VRDYLAWWLGHQESLIRPRTHHGYSQLLHDHVVPVIGELRLDRVRPAHVQAVLDGMRAKGRAPRTIVGARAVLGSAFAQALRWGLITANPVSAVRRPATERPKLDVPTAEELVALMEAAESTLWAVPVILSATTGARRGEVLGLRWADVDFDTRRVRTTWSLQRIGGELVFVDPKTDRARRTVTLQPADVERLKRHRAEQVARRLALGAGWVDLDLVSDRGDGGPLDPDAYGKGFRRIAPSAGLPPTVRLHDCRHAVATTMLDRGVHPAIASAVLGHASPAFTMSTYQHVLDGMTDQAADALGIAFGR